MNIFSLLKPPDLLSILNALLGFAAVLAASREEAQISVILILLAAAADGLDGLLARSMGSGPLGANLDSLADLVSFGVAPAALAMTVFDVPWHAWAVGGIFLSCGTLRLARFNISPKNDLFFEGLPIPAAGIIASTSVLLNKPVLTLIIMLLLSVFMVSSISYPKVRDPKLLALLGLVFLAAAFLILRENFSGYATILFYTATIIYLSSPVVMSYLRREKQPPLKPA